MDEVGAEAASVAEEVDMSSVAEEVSSATLSAQGGGRGGRGRGRGDVRGRRGRSRGSVRSPRRTGSAPRRLTRSRPRRRPLDPVAALTLVRAAATAMALTIRPQLREPSAARGRAAGCGVDPATGVRVV